MKIFHVSRGQTMACLPLILSAMFCLCSCQKQGLSEDTFHPMPTFWNEDDIPHIDEGPPCNGQIAFDIEYDTGSLPFEVGNTVDLAFVVNLPLTPAYELDHDCFCSEIVFCIEFAYPLTDFNSIGVRKMASSDDPISYIYQAPHLQTGNPVSNPTATAPTQSYVACVDFVRDGNVILLDLPEDFPTNIPLTDLIVSSGGLCIVDNIPDPKG